jgi:hypothetical protein
MATKTVPPPKLGGNRGNAGKGRPKGVPNKATAALKDAILNAFTEVGGEGYLAQVARDDPRTFCTLLGKVLPLQIAGDENGGPVRLIVSTGVPRD